MVVLTVLLLLKRRKKTHLQTAKLPASTDSPGKSNDSPGLSPEDGSAAQGFSQKSGCLDLRRSTPLQTSHSWLLASNDEIIERDESVDGDAWEQDDVPAAAASHDEPDLFTLLRTKVSFFAWQGHRCADRIGLGTDVLVELGLAMP